MIISETVTGVVLLDELRNQNVKGTTDGVALTLIKDFFAVATKLF